MSLGAKIQREMARTAQAGAVGRNSSVRTLYPAKITSIETTGVVVARFESPVPGQGEVITLSRPIPPNLRIGDIINIEVRKRRGMEPQVFICRGKIEFPLPGQPGPLKPEPAVATPEPAMLGPTTPSELLATGRGLKKEANRNRGNLTEELKGRIVAWIASAQTAITAYQAGQISGQKYGQPIAEQALFAALHEMVEKMRRILPQEAGATKPACPERCASLDGLLETCRRIVICHQNRKSDEGARRELLELGALRIKPWLEYLVQVAVTIDIVERIYPGYGSDIRHHNIDVRTAFHVLERYNLQKP